MSPRNSDRQGFTSMEPEERRYIAQQGGQASHGGQGRYEKDHEEDYNDEKEDEYGDGNHPSSRYHDDAAEEAPQ